MAWGKIPELFHFIDLVMIIKKTKDRIFDTLEAISDIIGDALITKDIKQASTWNESASALEFLLDRRTEIPITEHTIRLVIWSSKEKYCWIDTPRLM